MWSDIFNTSIMWSDTDNSFVVSLFVCYICHLSKLISPPSTLLNIHSISHFLIRNGWTSEVRLSLKKWGPYHITWISDWEGKVLKSANLKTLKLQSWFLVDLLEIQRRQNCSDEEIYEIMEQKIERNSIIRKKLK